ncbi:MAG TPA: 2-phospho-L-lactate transferase CofD family protein, partial [Vicinamibacterales bacterium]|nr:2-phospho-L-lactate transferase CofD family protein [Vicinamibacterales bacterium]
MTAPTAPRPSSRELRVVLFSGGRGSGALVRTLAANTAVRLTVAINGYDDGASTGEVRRFLGDSLGPSDFRKNASRLAGLLGTADPLLAEALEQRLPMDADAAVFRQVADDLIERLPAETRLAIAERLARFDELQRTSGRPFNFADCALGNLVFAGSYLTCDRDFNRAVDDYCALLGLPPGIVENVTDGTNAYLVAIDAAGAVLGSEEAIVDARRQNRIAEIYLIDRRLDESERLRLQQEGPEKAAAWFEEHSARLRMNPRLAAPIAAAQLIVYAPGTQHSSLFPSYLTPGLSRAIASNLSAIKLLITNLQSDAEITGQSAVDIIDRALYYLKERGSLAIPTPCLITHYLINDPGQPTGEAPYVPLGAVETIEDPRLVRISNYEDGVSGRHDAVRVLAPFVESFVREPSRPKVAVVLHDAGSINKVAQTLLEMVRGGIADVPVEVTVFYDRPETFEDGFLKSLPFRAVQQRDGHRATGDALRQDGFEYVLLFESSGMYRGEDAVSVLAQLSAGRVDAVWGSRRLSVRDIEESLRLRYRGDAVQRLVSSVGSHALSLACLARYGRYVSDTLSGVRAVRARDALSLSVPLTHKHANQYLLAALLRRRAELLEIPVQFLPLSPERVKRTTVAEGLRALGILLT